MTTRKTIAIIGATGNMGSAVAGRLAKGPYRLLLMSADAQKLDDLQKFIVEKSGGMTEVIANDCAKEASWEADIIIVATPYEDEKRVAETIREVAVGKIVVCISNPLDRLYTEMPDAPDSSAAEELQKLLPYSIVVKTFNTTFAADFFHPMLDGNGADAFVAGNDSGALDEVSEVLHTAGFNPTVVGNLALSQTLERMQLMLIKLGMKNDYNWLARWKLIENTGH